MNYIRRAVNNGNIFLHNYVFLFGLGLFGLDYKMIQESHITRYYLKAFFNIGFILIKIMLLTLIRAAIFPALIISKLLKKIGF